MSVERAETMRFIALTTLLSFGKPGRLLFFTDKGAKDKLRKVANVQYVEGCVPLLPYLQQAIAKRVTIFRG